jgi:hypothetical protein
MDNDIKAVFIGILTASLLIAMVAGHKAEAHQCTAVVKDAGGNKHEFVGISYD